MMCCAGFTGNYVFRRNIDLKKKIITFSITKLINIGI